MALPVNQAGLPAQPQPPAQPPLAQAPLGTGAASTTMQPAPGAAPPRDIGIVETILISIKNLIVKLFSMIFCCFKKAEEPPVPAGLSPPPAPPVVAPPVVAPPQLPQLVQRIQDDVNLLNEFQRLPEDIQNRIYIRIGQGRNLRFMRMGSDLEAGRAKVQSDPQILRQYIVLPAR